ncbi:MAG: FKBP-type peptidyl-prolyl cis-trans isomerase [Methylacidiphilales bacterium]|nr:FKBP-type peptidyl-prolyl cis-trans isomerase [Candidatus Methylacidiphilales bacterium]
MKMLPSLRYRRFVFAGMLFLALTFGAVEQLFTGNVLQAQSAPPAPSGMASQETDSESGKPVITTPSGLKYVDLVVGTGPAAKSGDHLAVNYEGKLQDGTKFDSSYDRGQPFSLVLGVTQVIQGWTEGLAGMKAGGKRKLIIPPQLGYGQAGAGDTIPPNATLIFKVEIMSIEASPSGGI